MTRKYDLIDERLLQWLRENPGQATTAAAIEALAVKCTTTQRHISRRFTLLEDKGAIVCELQGTTRVCTVQPDRLPAALHKGGLNNRTWRERIRGDIDGLHGVRRREGAVSFWIRRPDPPPVEKPTGEAPPEDQPMEDQPAAMVPVATDPPAKAARGSTGEVPDTPATIATVAPRPAPPATPSR